MEVLVETVLSLLMSYRKFNCFKLSTDDCVRTGSRKSLKSTREGIRDKLSLIHSPSLNLSLCNWGYTSLCSSEVNFFLVINTKGCFLACRPKEIRLVWSHCLCISGCQLSVTCEFLGLLSSTCKIGIFQGFSRNQASRWKSGFREAKGVWLSGLLKTSEHKFLTARLQCF